MCSIECILLEAEEGDLEDVVLVEAVLVEVSETTMAEYKRAINAVDQITLPETVMRRVLNAMLVVNLKDISYIPFISHF